MVITTKQTVLIIDDDQSEVLITKRVLSMAAPEIEVEAAFSGEEGLARLRGGGPPPALVLLDLKMPGLNGLGVLRQMRADELLKHLPVIIVTNSTLESDRQDSLAAGANDYLHKAFDLKRFAADIESLLERYLG
jgi:CheY-like chemotaxis protein